MINENSQILHISNPLYFLFLFYLLSFFFKKIFFFLALILLFIIQLIQRHSCIVIDF